MAIRLAENKEGFAPELLRELRELAERIPDDADEVPPGEGLRTGTELKSFGTFFDDPNLTAFAKHLQTHGYGLSQAGLHVRCYLTRSDHVLVGETLRELREEVLVWLETQP